MTKMCTLLDSVRAESESLVLKALKSGQVDDEEFNACDTSGRTCLSYAAALGSLAMIDMLHATGRVDPNRPDKEGNSPLIYSVSLGHYLATMKMLSWVEIDINHQNNSGFSPLMKAAIHGQLSCVELLISSGANTDLVDNVRQITAFQWAKFCGSHDCAKVLKKCTDKKASLKRNSIGRKMSVSFSVKENNNGTPNLNRRRSSMQRIKSMLSNQQAKEPMETLYTRDNTIPGVNSIVMCTSTPAIPVLLSNCDHSEVIQRTGNSKISELDSQKILKELNLSPLLYQRCTPKIKITKVNGETITPNSRSFREVRKRNKLIVNKKAN